MSVEILVPIVATVVLGLTGYLYREHRTRKEPPHPDGWTWKTCALLAFCDTERPLAERRLSLRTLNRISIQTINDISSSNNFRATQTERIFKREVLSDLKTASLIVEAGGYIKNLSNRQRYELTAVGVNSIQNIFDEIREHIVERDFSRMAQSRDKLAVGTIIDSKIRIEVVSAFSPLLSGNILQAPEVLTPQPEVLTPQRDYSREESRARTIPKQKSTERRTHGTSGQTASSKAYEFHITFASSKRATGYLKNSDELRGGFLVAKGSLATKDEASSISPTYKALRQRLAEDGILSSQGEHYRFASDYLFSSPSAASSVVLGRSSNGRHEWKSSDEKRQSLGDLLKALSSESEQTVAGLEHGGVSSSTKRAKIDDQESPTPSAATPMPSEIRYAVFRHILEGGPVHKDALIRALPGRLSWKNLSANRRKKAEQAIRWNIQHEYLQQYSDQQVNLNIEREIGLQLTVESFRNK